MLRSTPRAVMTVVIAAALALSPISTAGGATDIFDSGVSAGADFDSLKAAGNTDAQDLWSDGTTMYVSDSADGKIYAYAMSTPRERDAPKDLDLHGDNANPYGIWSDDTTLWVVDRAETYVYAYTLADGTHDADKGFDLVNSSADARNEAPAGLWSDGTFLWVFDAGSRPAAHLYSLVDGHVVDGNTYDYGDFFEQRWQFYTAFDAWSERSTSNPTAKNAWAVYDFHDGGTPGQYTGILHGEDFDTGRNDSDFDFRVPGAAGLNGVWSADGSTFWALSNRDDKIYSVMPPVVPSAPEDLTAAEAGSSGSLTLTWSAVPDEDKGSSDIVGYEVRYRQLDSGDWTSVRRSSPLALTETVTGLVDYIDYAVAVRALNGQLPSDWVEATAIPTEPAAAGTPPAPQALTSTGLVGGFELSWTAPTVEQGTAAITGYDVRYRFAETSSRGAWVVDDPITDPAITTATVSGVRKLAKYDIQVRAVNSVGGGAWATVTPGGIVRDGFKDLHEVTGVWSNDSTMWVAGRNEIRAFSLATGARDEADDFSSGELFSAEALVVSGDVDVDDYYIEAIWSDGTYLWVAYSVFAPDIYSQRFVNAYNLETQARVESQDFGRLLPPRYSMVIRDMWSDGETMWVLDSIYSYAFAFDLDTKARAPHHEFSVGPRSLYRKPNGGWTDGVTIWIHWEKDRNVEAFDLVTKERVPQADSSLVARGSSTGINNAGARIWADEGSAWFSTGSRLVAFDLLRRPGLPADAAVVNGDKKVTVSWEQSDSGGQPTGYEVQYRADRETSWRDVSRADSAAVSETISDLVNRTLYDIRVRGVLGERHGPWAKLLASPALAVGTLGAPEGLTVTGDTETGPEGGRDRALDISWEAPAGATNTTYDVQYRLDGTRGRWTSAASGATDQSVRVTGLVAGGRYQVRVNAVENHQWGPWAVAANRAGRGFYNLERLQVQWGCSGCLERFNGIWSDGSTLWLTVEDVYPPSSLRAYDLGSKERLYAEDVVDLPLSAPHGLWGDNSDFFIVDNPEWSVRVLFEPPHGVAKAGQVSKEADESFALGRRSGNGFSNPMHVAGNDAPLGVWSNGTTIWVSDGDDVKIYAYYASTGERNRDEDFDTLKIADGGSPVAVISLLRDDVVSMQRPYGLWSDGTTMWVADRVTDRIFAFNLETTERDGELHRWLQVNGHDDRWEHMQPTDGGVQYGSEAEFG